MQIHTTQDRLVTKFIHDDGSETAIKTVPSIKAVRDSEGNVTSEYVERNKYSIFISISAGCHFNCNFCHLTMKGAKFTKLTAFDVIDNIKEALTHEVKAKPELMTKYVKLSFMGMGDAFGSPVNVSLITRELAAWIMENGYACGLDGVDISTVMPPKVNTEIYRDIYHSLNRHLADTFALNPESFRMDNIEQSSVTEYTNRSVLRVFYSVGAPTEAKRAEMIPNTMELTEAIHTLDKICGNDINLIYHYMFIEDQNSDDDSVLEFLELYHTQIRANLHNREIRILRYNSCNVGWYEESGRFNEIIEMISPQIKKLKVQRSLGSEVKAACGEFLVTKFINTDSIKAEIKGEK